MAQIWAMWIYGLNETKWTQMLKLMAEQATGSGSPANNPRVPDNETIVELYRQAWA